MPFNAFVEIYSPRNEAQSQVNMVYEGGSAYSKASLKAKQRHFIFKEFLERFGASAADDLWLEDRVWN